MVTQLQQRVNTDYSKRQDSLYVLNIALDMGAQPVAVGSHLLPGCSARPRRAKPESVLDIVPLNLPPAQGQSDTLFVQLNRQAELFDRMLTIHRY